MRVLICGSTGCVGAAVVHALRSRGHKVVEGSRSAVDGRGTLHVDFMQPRTPAEWAERLRAAQIDTVVNCVGILMASRAQSFERIHSQGPIELFRGAAAAGVGRVVQVSALGVGDDAEALATPYLHSKLLADDALAALPLDWAVLRPSLVYGPRSQSAALFATLASLPVVSLPGRGEQRVQPIHVYELAEAITRLIESPAPTRSVFELGGPAVLSYREMLSHYRGALRLGDALWLPLPMALMRTTAWLAELLPQKVLCRDTIRLLERGSAPGINAAPALLGRAPSTMPHGLAITPPEPHVDLRVQMSPALALALRISLAFMWGYTSLVSALLPDHSGVLGLLARCGFEGEAGIAVLVLSCALNLTLAALVLLRPTPWTHALQAGAVVGYTLAAALAMPELTIDHCGPLAKNLPVLMLVLVSWCAVPAASTHPPVARRAAPATIAAKHPLRAS